MSQVVNKPGVKKVCLFKWYDGWFLSREKKQCSTLVCSIICWKGGIRSYLILVTEQSEMYMWL